MRVSPTRRRSHPASKTSTSASPRATGRLDRPQEIRDGFDRGGDGWVPDDVPLEGLIDPGALGVVPGGPPFQISARFTTDRHREDASPTLKSSSGYQRRSNS